VAFGNGKFVAAGFRDSYPGGNTSAAKLGSVDATSAY